MKPCCNSKKTTVEAALRQIRRGGRIFIGSGCAEPGILSRGLIEFAHCFADNPILHIHAQGEAAYIRPEYADNFRHNAFVIGPSVREAVQAGRADYTPISLSEVPALFSSGTMSLDAALIQITPPDTQGFCSLGVSVDIVKAAAQCARIVIAQMNPLMPRTLGDSFIHIDEIDFLIEYSEAIHEVPLAAINESAEHNAIVQRIGANVARLVKDGATLQVGGGLIPNAVLSHLTEKNDLGIHTEMFSDGLMELMKKGAANGSRKTVHRGQAIASWCMGTRALYDWIHQNPNVQFYPSEYTNDSGVIRQNDDMVAINSAFAVDLTGQVCLEEPGEQIDFMRGAAQSRRGRPIIALPSTAENGTQSRIVATLAPGSSVAASQSDVHYIVTEHGIASLHGKSVSERARALIEIAHPDFRHELLEAAKTQHYVGSDLRNDPKGNFYPARYEHTKNFGDAQRGEMPIFFRPIRTSDERLLQDFFYSHSEETIRGRYGYNARAMSRQQALRMVQLNYHTRLAIVGLVGEPDAERIVAVGRYEGHAETRLAEVAFVVHEDFRNLGIASHLLSLLTNAAREAGFCGVATQILEDNQAMRRVYEKVLGSAEEISSISGEVMLRYDFEDVPFDEPVVAS
jgi:acyl-CoA hydrolase/GNAT superfamily N-acetyltransferase